MNKAKTLLLNFNLFIFLVFPAKTSGIEEDLSHFMAKAICLPFSFALDVISVPLTKLSTNSLPQESIESFEDSIRSISEKNFSKAAEDLEKSATLGNPEAMYHMGLLMLSLSEKNFDSLKHHVPYNSNMGIAFLKSAHEKKFEKAGEILEFCNDIVEATRVYTIAYGLDGKEPNIPLAKKSLKRLIKKGNPVAEYFYADALLANGLLIHPWILEQEASLLERRKKSVPLLCHAASKKMPTAAKLMEELEREDQLYEIICGMILQNATTKIAGLSLGKAGFQGAYIDYLVNKGYKIQGYALNLELALFMKEIMALRVKQLFYFFSDYYRYLGCLNAMLIDSGNSEIDRPALLINMKKEIVGKYICVLDKLGVRPHLKDITVDFRVHGLLHPITEHDASRAYAMLIEGDEDF